MEDWLDLTLVIRRMDQVPKTGTQIGRSIQPLQVHMPYDTGSIRNIIPDMSGNNINYNI